MKHIKLNLLLIIALLPLSLMANERKGSIEKTKEIRKTYQVGNTGNVNISNSFGNINVSTWQKNVVEISVRISVDGNNAEMVNKQLNSIGVIFTDDAQQIRASTQIKNVSSGWSLWSLFAGNSKNVNYKIDYQVKMPINHDLKIINEYGNIYLDELDGSLNLNCDYGKFSIGNLNNENNTIKIDYFSKSSIGFIKGGNIVADYSRINIELAHRLKMTCDYTKIHIDNVRYLKYANDYGSIHVDNATNIVGGGDYQSRYFGNVNSLVFKGDYGSIKIDGLKDGFDNINLTCDYVSINILNTYKTAYTFKLIQEYGCFKNEGLVIQNEVVDNGDKRITGFYKDEHAHSSIKIIEDYGCIKIIN